MNKDNSIPSVSIIIPSYNGEVYLESIIETIRPFYYEGYEIILVDDGSSENDNTLKEFSFTFPKAICVKQENGGVAKARNTGVNLATKDFLQFLDIDDSISSKKIKIQYDAAINNDVDIVYSDWCMMIVDEDGNKKQEPMVISGSFDDYIQALIERWWNPPHSYLIRKQAYIDIGGGDEQLVNAQDFDVFIRLAIMGNKFFYQPGLFSFYYRYLYNESLARGPKKRYWKDTERVVDKSISLLERDNNFQEKYKQAAAQRLFLIARNTYKIDKQWCDSIFNKLKNMDPYFFPKHESWKFKFLFRIFGYQKTENIINKLKF